MKPRADLFTFIHKSLREGIAETLCTLQRSDLGNDADLSAAMSLLDLNLKALGDHGVHEDTHVFNHLARKQPDLVKKLDADHHKAHDLLHAVAEYALQLRAMADPMARRVMSGELIRKYVDMMVFYLGHLNDEERFAGPELQQHFTDEELEAMRTAVQSSIPPDEFMSAIKYGFRSGAVYELGGMLGAMKVKLPPPVLEAILKEGDAHTTPERMAAIRAIGGL